MTIRKTESGCFEVTVKNNGLVFHVGVFDDEQTAKEHEQSFKGYCEEVSE